jgi:GNAT superfamily N-acetyltransferase
MKLQVASADDVADLVSLHAAVNARLISQYGEGYWAAGLSEKGVLFAMRRATVLIARRRERPIATLALSTRKPWAIDKNAAKYFSPTKRPLYLTGMEVHPEEQRKGVGRLCIEEARRIAAKWPADAIRLDAYDTAAGAGEFYRKCGFREVGRSIYRKAPLIYFEMLV